MDRKKKKYSRDFSDRYAVKRSWSKACRVADSLGINDNLIYYCRKAFAKVGTLQREVHEPPSMQAEVQQLREENRQLKMEREILKKAMAFFAIEVR